MKKVKKILIIDDDATTAFLHQRLLQCMDVAEEIEYITDPQQALEYLQNNRSSAADLIFLDVEMPQMDGFQFLDKLEAGGVPLKDVSIVMHTASMSPEHKKKAETLYSEKLKGFVQKPLRPECIKEAISRVKSA
ncbi:response regulator [Cesiribacter sp. SM1]|uniref:response regulator n=1 Tax=Cesiribacter sp. SM1 TaxID=2861196 RepID=UPI001CD6CD66|nr:response regulator [Cesiribacter sp. SM1]